MNAVSVVAWSVRSVHHHHSRWNGTSREQPQHGHQRTVTCQLQWPTHVRRFGHMAWCGSLVREQQLGRAVRGNPGFITALTTHRAMPSQRPRKIPVLWAASSCSVVTAQRESGRSWAASSYAHAQRWLACRTATYLPEANSSSTLIQDSSTELPCGTARNGHRWEPASLADHW